MAVKRVVYPKYATNAKYQGEINRFKKWVDEHCPRENETALYVTRENVDAYYVEDVQVNRINIETDSAHAIHRALQWLVDHVESKATGGKPMVVRDEEEPKSTINWCLFNREVFNAEWQMTSGIQDAHHGLKKKALTFSDHEKVCK